MTYFLPAPGAYKHVECPRGTISPASTSSTSLPIPQFKPTPTLHKPTNHTYPPSSSSCPKHSAKTSTPRPARKWYFLHPLLIPIHANTNPPPRPPTRRNPRSKKPKRASRAVRTRWRAARSRTTASRARKRCRTSLGAARMRRCMVGPRRGLWIRRSMRWGWIRRRGMDMIMCKEGGVGLI